ncbi:MAG: DinB family protein [Anaerolineae bacterium]
MNKTYFHRLYDYNFWAHRRVWACVVELSDEQFTRPHDYSIGSIHAQVVHTMGAEDLWLSRITGGTKLSLPAPHEYPTREAIRSAWDNVEAAWRAYLDTLTDETLTQAIHYRNLKLEPKESLLCDILMHVANHGTDHRAQTLALLHQLGAKTIEQDVIYYAREIPQL